MACTQGSQCNFSSNGDIFVVGTAIEYGTLSLCFCVCVVFNWVVATALWVHFSSWLTLYDIIGKTRVLFLIGTVEEQHTQCDHLHNNISFSLDGELKYMALFRLFLLGILKDKDEKITGAIIRVV